MSLVHVAETRLQYLSLQQLFLNFSIHDSRTFLPRERSSFNKRVGVLVIFQRHPRKRGSMSVNRQCFIRFSPIVLDLIGIIMLYHTSTVAQTPFVFDCNSLFCSNIDKGLCDIATVPMQCRNPEFSKLSKNHGCY